MEAADRHHGRSLVERDRLAACEWWQDVGELCLVQLMVVSAQGAVDQKRAVPEDRLQVGMVTYETCPQLPH